MSAPECNGDACHGGIDCQSGCAIEAFGETPLQPGLIHHEVQGRGFGRTEEARRAQAEHYREVGPQPAAVAYTPPKYGPPPGVNPVKWRAMSRADRRAHLRELARTLNHVARQPEPEQ